jgi:ribosomal protein S19
VLVSGDNRFAEVLGYSDSGSFDEDLLPDNMKAWLQGIIEEMKELDARGYAPVKTSRRAAEAWPAIKPMTMTKWFQGAPYNDLLPTDEVIGHYLAGCMTIATAQLVNYWAQKTGEPAKTLKPIPAYTTDRGIACYRVRLDEDARCV